MKNKIYHTVKTIQTSNTIIVERDKIKTSNTQIHDHSLSWLGTGTSIKSGGVKIVLWAHNLSLYMYKLIYHAEFVDSSKTDET
jgi:hypothetical protein